MIFSCDRCGETWPDHPVTRVRCPTCRVAVGTWCRRPSGHRAMDLHIDREHAALAAGILQKCLGLPDDRLPKTAGQFVLDL
ncbi:MAG: hypothetical protein BGO05_24640 [Rhizobiales bacterium 63-7]|nr:hypothetical protein [Hyphomicrobiales bacterium]OJU68917.1 MAG: hypothetical protein BGO05_24640 [Rhizobiales bacterium 63-7]